MSRLILLGCAVVGGARGLQEAGIQSQTEVFCAVRRWGLGSPLLASVVGSRGFRRHLRVAGLFARWCSRVLGFPSWRGSGTRTEHGGGVAGLALVCARTYGTISWTASLDAL